MALQHIRYQLGEASYKILPPSFIGTAERTTWTNLRAFAG